MWDQGIRGHQPCYLDVTASDYSCLLSGLSSVLCLIMAPYFEFTFYIMLNFSSPIGPCQQQVACCRAIQHQILLLLIPHFCVTSLISHGSLFIMQLPFHPAITWESSLRKQAQRFSSTFFPRRQMQQCVERTEQTIRASRVLFAMCWDSSQPSAQQ